MYYENLKQCRWKVVGFVFWRQWMSVQDFMAYHQIFLWYFNQNQPRPLLLEPCYTHTDTQTHTHTLRWLLFLLAALLPGSRSKENLEFRTLKSTPAERVTQTHQSDRWRQREEMQRVPSMVRVVCVDIVSLWHKCLNLSLHLSPDHC